MSLENIFKLEPNFSEPRLDELFFRYKARNYPERLSPEERQDWEVYRQHRMTHPDGEASIKWDEYQQELDAFELAELDGNEQTIIQALTEYPGLIGLK